VAEVLIKKDVRDLSMCGAKEYVRGVGGVDGQ
jgi:hypothetical protein